MSHSATVDTRPQQAVATKLRLRRCQHPVAKAMTAALRRGRPLLTLLPCEERMGFPLRRGCLDFFDDPSYPEGPRQEPVPGALHMPRRSVRNPCKRDRPWLMAGVKVRLEPPGVLRRREMPAGSACASGGFRTSICGCRKAPPALSRPQP